MTVILYMDTVLPSAGLSERGALAWVRLVKKAVGGWSLQDAEGVEGRGEGPHYPNGGLVERLKLPQRGLGRDPIRNCILHNCSVIVRWAC